MSSCFPLSSQFQSTPPARGATAAASMSSDPACNFNPRPPRGGRPRQLEAVCKRCHISIHAPREGGDDRCAASSHPGRKFQSTPPARGATVQLHPDREISAFQSTPPARGATAASNKTAAESLFQSTPPARGATLRRHFLTYSTDISIHAPREGGDRGYLRQHGLCRTDFNPRPPRGGRRQASAVTSG